MAINDWTAATLNTDADCRAEENNIDSWTNKRPLDEWITVAKNELAGRLQFALRQTAVDTGIDITEILDHIESYEFIRKSATYMTLHKCAKGASINPNDFFDNKASQYYSLFLDEWERAVQMLSVDVDDSGTIDTGENFNVDNDTTFIRGG